MAQQKGRLGFFAKKTGCHVTHLTNKNIALTLSVSLISTVMVSAVQAAQSPVIRGPLPYQAQYPTTTTPRAQNAENPVLFDSAEVSYDEQLGFVKLNGEVEIAQGDQVLMAEEVVYHPASNRVTASGRVKLLQPDGNVVFANFVELSDEMKEGFIRDLRALLSDDSRFAALTAERRGAETVMNKAVYSPCDLCKEDPSKSPLWQIKAEKIIHNQETQNINYENAWMEFFGVPVAYMPYFSHPDPTVERRSGFLTPGFRSSSATGFTIKTPYHYVASQDLDATFTPHIMFNGSGILDTEIRKSFENLRLKLRGSVGYVQKPSGNGKKIRGDLEGDLQWHLNRNWRITGDLHWASDDTYGSVFGFNQGQGDILTSKLEAERFAERSYAKISAVRYQGLRASDNDATTPYVLPYIQHEYKTEIDKIGGEWTVATNAVSLHRREGVKTNRLSITGSYDLPLLLNGGHEINLTAALRGDVYEYSDFVTADNRTLSDASSRLVPVLSAEWRYPLVKQGQNVQYLLEPMANLTWSTNGNNPDDIPNEDGQLFELDDTNLMLWDRTPGIDIVDSGARITYGLGFGIYGNRGLMNGFVGQSYRVSENSDFTSQSGIDDRFSDIVGRLNIIPSDFLDLRYQFRFDQKSFKSQRQELQLSAGVPLLRVGANYSFVSENLTGSASDKLEELSLSISSQFHENWRFRGGAVRDMDKDEMRSFSSGLVYNDECFEFGLDFQRSYYEDREVEPENKFMVYLNFKHLGGLSTSTPSF